MKALEIPLPEWIAAAKARADAAIPGPWEIDPEDPTGVWGNAGRNFVGSLEWADDAEFIAHARLDVPALCEALERVLALAATLDAEAYDDSKNAQSWGDFAILSAAAQMKIDAADIRNAVDGVAREASAYCDVEANP